MLTYVIRVTEKIALAPIHCVPAVPDGSIFTLCGWANVEYREEEAVPDCPDCLSIVAYCKELDVPEPPR